MAVAGIEYNTRAPKPLKKPNGPATVYICTIKMKEKQVKAKALANLNIRYIQAFFHIS